MRRVAVDQLPGVGELVLLPAESSHHLLVVCRHPRGADLVLFDGTGRECPATLVEVDDGLARVAATGPARLAIPGAPLHLVLGLPKGPATDDAIRMATEVGVTAVHPVWAARTQGRPDRTDRWLKIARSAAAQCGRADVPDVHEPADLYTVLERLEGIALFVAHPGLASEAPTGSAPSAVCVGPEGGWDARELEALWEAGAHPMDLGRWILRTPTAVAVALSRLAD